MYARAGSRRLRLACGVIALLVGFVGLVVADNHFNRMWPWWLIGLVGGGLVLTALGNPRQRSVESARDKGGLEP